MFCDGDGESVKVWKDAWVPSNQSRLIISPVETLIRALMLALLSSNHANVEYYSYQEYVPSL